jgi:hypothetical protein
MSPLSFRVGIVAGRLLEPYSLPPRLTGAVYRDFLHNSLPELLQDVICRLWFNNGSSIMVFRHIYGPCILMLHHIYGSSIMVLHHINVSCIMVLHHIYGPCIFMHYGVPPHFLFAVRQYMNTVSGTMDSTRWNNNMARPFT